MTNKVTIYKPDGSIRHIIDPDANSQQSGQIMSTDMVAVNFTSKEAILFSILDYANIFRIPYKINTLPEVTKISGLDYQYIITLEGLMFDLTKVQYLFLNASNVFTEGKFTLRGKPRDFGDLIIHNLRRIFPNAPWKLGSVIDADYKSIDFNSQNCMEALSTVTKSFTTEYSFDGYTINIYQKQLPSGINLTYGYENPLYGLSRKNTDNSNVITRLYAFGSNKNIGSNYRLGAQYLRMAAGLYIEKNTDIYGVFEGCVNFDGTNGNIEIYPHRTGTVTGVTLPYTAPFTFVDNTMDFDVNPYLMPDGSAAVITFNTGLLGGLNFNLNAYNAATKTFTINPDTSQTTIVAPSIDWAPAVGDQYVITNILQPIAYINNAEALLLSSAKDYLDIKSTPNVTYSVVCNPLFFKANPIPVVLGQTVGIVDAALGINRQIRITAYTRNLRNPALYTMTLSDTVKVQSTIVKIINGL